MTRLVSDTDQAQDKSFMDKVIDLSTLTNADNIPRTREQHAAAVRTLFTESAERGRAVRGDDKT